MAARDGGQENKRGDLVVRNLTEMTVCNYDAAAQLLEEARRNRQVKPTKMNAGSSRSHLIYDVKLTQMPFVPGSSVLDYSRIRIAKLSVIDLAGSERAVRTQNTGDRLNEASNINASLMTLRRCMEVRSRYLWNRWPTRV